MECPPRDESFRDPCHDILRRPVAMSCSGEVPTDTADGDGEDNFVDDERNGNNVEVGVGGADEALSSEACPNSKVHVHVHVANEKKYSSPPDLSLAAVVPIRPRADPVQRGGQLLRSPPVLLANILPRRPVRLELRRGFGPHLRLPAGVRDIGPGLRPDRHDRRRVQGLVRTRAVPRRRRPVPRPLPPLPAICRCVAGGCGAAPGPRFAAVVRCHCCHPARHPRCQIRPGTGPPGMDADLVLGRVHRPPAHRGAAPGAARVRVGVSSGTRRDHHWCRRRSPRSGQAREAGLGCSKVLAVADAHRHRYSSRLRT